MASHRSTLSTAACPNVGRTAWIATATRMKMTLAGVPARKPSLPLTAIAASTMNAMPSISNPTWVIQLRNEGTLFPFGLNGERLIAKVVVAARRPCRLARPVSR